MATYLKSLRRHVIPQLERVTNTAAIRGLENRMYVNTFKGAIEALQATIERYLPQRVVSGFFLALTDRPLPEYTGRRVP
jgi:hypothetical protein